MLWVPFYCMQKIRPLCIITSGSICQLSFRQLLENNLKKKFIREQMRLHFVDWTLHGSAHSLHSNAPFLVCSDSRIEKKPCKMIGNEEQFTFIQEYYGIRNWTVRISIKTNCNPIHQPSHSIRFNSKRFDFQSISSNLSSQFTDKLCHT